MMTSFADVPSADFPFKSDFSDSRLQVHGLRGPLGYMRDTPEISVRFDWKTRALWALWRPAGSGSFTPGLLQSIRHIYEDVAHYMEAVASAGEPPVKFLVIGSAVPGVFNLGGDLSIFVDAIVTGDRDFLLNYARDCVECVASTALAHQHGVVTVGMVEGDALGGGFEAALAFDILIAGRGCKMGFPEVRFNSFPGMGAVSLLSRKVGQSMAKRLVAEGKIFGVEDLNELGLIDYLVEPGKVREMTQEIVQDKHGLQPRIKAISRAFSEMNLGLRDEMHRITALWVDTMMALTPMDLRRIRKIVSAQQRRLSAC